MRREMAMGASEVGLGSRDSVLRVGSECRSRTALDDHIVTCDDDRLSN